MAKISVIVPIYNSEKYLKKTIESILNQTMKDLEIILVDDGSTDLSPLIIDEFAQKDNRVITIHQKNGGLGKSMNTGLNTATGDYIGIVESDDYIANTMYEDLYKIAKEYDSDIVKSAFYDNLQSKEEQRILKVKWNDKKIPQNKSFSIKECGLFLRYHPSVWTCIYKKRFLDKNDIRYSELSGGGWADNPFQVKTMCLAKKINYTPKAYYFWTRRHRNESDDLQDYSIPFKIIFEIHQWLKDNNINEEEILSNLYVRELTYIKIVLGIKNINIPDCLKLINKTCLDMNSDLIFKSVNVKNKYKKLFSDILKNPLKVRRLILFNNFKKDLISIHWNKEEKRIILLSKLLYKQNKEVQQCR